MIANAVHDMARNVVDNATHASLSMAPTQIGTTSLAPLQENMERVPPNDARSASLGGGIS